jgi:prepilin-type N-terminal cleavage/methylation domain-containing protein
MKKGFTLVELAIVVIIIGLLVAGTLAGQELIRQAQTKSMLNQIKSYNQAAVIFRTKYGHLPGDLPNASDFGINLNSNREENTADTLSDATNSTHLGNGDGDGRLVDGWGGNSFYGSEMANFWLHLSNSGFIKELFYADKSLAQYMGSGSIGVGYPPLKYNENTGILLMPATDYEQGASSGNYFIVGVQEFYGPEMADGTSMQKAFSGGGDFTPATLNSRMAFILDSKLDDGLANSGSIQPIASISQTSSGYTIWFCQYSGYCAGGGTVLENGYAGGGCTNGDDGKQYYLDDPEVKCMLPIKADF